MADEDVHTFENLGLEINFPFEPYGTQKNMMNMVTSTLVNKEHSLLESPTGTGKTLVLLCSTLAWQKKFKAIGTPFITEKVKKAIATERREKLMNKPCLCGRRLDGSELDKLEEDKENTTEKEKFDICADDDDNHKKDLGRKIDSGVTQLFSVPDSWMVKKMKRDLMLDDDYDNLKETSSIYFQKPKSNDSDIIIIDDESDDDTNCTKAANDDSPIIKNEIKPEIAYSRPSHLRISCTNFEAGDDYVDTDAIVPKIYYGTRTHKQITQVIRELNKTPYKKDLRMCILSSRKRTCINDNVKDAKNRNDLCLDLLKRDGCRFYKGSNGAAIFEEINFEFKDKAWDIEDAVSFGRSRNTCPYFGLRDLQMEADITFSPYSCLLDPVVRNSLDLKLNYAIVILDEAHNIEDVCREGASYEIDTNRINNILDTIKLAKKFHRRDTDVMDAYIFFMDKFLKLKNLLIKYPFFGKPEEDCDYLYRKILYDNDILDTLTSLGLGIDNLDKFKKNLIVLIEDNKEKTGARKPALSSVQMLFISHLCITLEFIYAIGKNYVDDYRGVITKSLDHEFNQKQSGDDINLKHVWKFSLLCMNPAIAFEKIHTLAWSVIVTSGTLSPIESLKTELGCHFSNVYEGAHVVKAGRIFASIVSEGPTRVDLNCSWRSSILGKNRVPNFVFQDEVGKVVRDICTTVPHGVLCFFPSYNRMKNFYQRWSETGIIEYIQVKIGKKLYQEQQGSTSEMFEGKLLEYNRNAISSGAILFAVLRGKVSEGIDFADEAARAVITIGIPYAHLKDINVNLKREYNNVTRQFKPHLMTGSNWYASQAFRALNQALGRCIRHKEDWGAIIMIDSRLDQPTSLTKISKWLSKNVQITDSYPMMLESLEEFVNMRTAAAVTNTNANQQVIELDVD